MGAAKSDLICVNDIRLSPTPVSPRPRSGRGRGVLAPRVRVIGPARRFSGLRAGPITPTLDAPCLDPGSSTRGHASPPLSAAEVWENHELRLPVWRRLGGMAGSAVGVLAYHPALRWLDGARAAGRGARRAGQDHGAEAGPLGG